MAKFVVMSWNVENLFQPEDTITTFPRKTVMEASTYKDKLEHLKTVITEVDPDVLALQELGGDDNNVEKTLTDLNARLNGAYPHHAVSRHRDARNIRVAFLSKIRIHKDKTDHIFEFARGEFASVANWSGRAPATTLSRGALAIEVESASGVRLRLVTLHLKSKLLTYNRGENVSFTPNDENERAIAAGLALLRRTAEATTVRIYLNDRMQDDSAVHTVVLGDLNDEPKAATSQILNSAADKDVASDDKDDPARLYNLMVALPRRGGVENDTWFLPQNERYTRIYEGQGETIDHIYVSKGLIGESEAIRQGRWVLHGVRSLVAGIQSIGNNATEREGKAIPDHAPIYAVFEL